MVVRHGDAAAGSVEAPVVTDDIAYERPHPDAVKLSSLRRKTHKAKQLREGFLEGGRGGNCDIADDVRV